MPDADRRQGTIVAIDDDRSVLDSLHLLLETAGYRTRRHVDGEELLRHGPPDGPACLLMDLNMPGMNGIEVQRSLEAAGWTIPIVFLTGHGDVPSAVSALKSGAVDYLQKNEIEPAQLLERLELCLARHRQWMAEREAVENEATLLSSLTPREFEVAALASAGLTNKVIGLDLDISERTVEIHRGRAMKKLGLRTAADLARMKPAFDRRGGER